MLNSELHPPVIPPTSDLGEVLSEPTQELRLSPNRLAWLALSLLVIGLILGAAGMLLLRKPSTLLTKTTQPSSSPSFLPTVTESETILKNQVVYLVDQRAVWVYDREAGTTHLIKELPQDTTIKPGYMTARITNPRWIGEDQVVYQECGAYEAGQNYECRLILHDIQANTQQTLLTRQSVLNVSNYPVDGEVGLFAVNPQTHLLAYTVNQSPKLHLYLKNLATGEERALDSYVLTGGRGGYEEDDYHLSFSPNGERLLMVMTGLLPTWDGSPDQGTTFVYEVSSGEKIWSKTGQWTTFSRWLDNDRIVAKMTPLNEHQFPAGDAFLTLLTFPNQVEQLEVVTTWFRFLPTSSTEFLYMTKKTDQDTGTNLHRYDLDTRTSEIIGENLFPQVQLDHTAILAWPLTKCSDCYFTYNGYSLGREGETVTLQFFSLDSYQSLPTPIKLMSNDQVERQ
jgi:hypothetical protein